MAKEILNWDSVNLRLIVNSGDMHESNKERLAKERGTDLMGEIPVLNYFRKEGNEVPRCRDKVNECERNLGEYQEDSLAMCTDRTILITLSLG